MALTLLILGCLVAVFARFDERIAVRFTKPASTSTPTLRRGVTYPVEGVADDGGATYQAVGTVILELYGEDGRNGKVGYGSSAARYDRSSKRFSGTIRVPKNVSKTHLWLEAVVIDNTGRHHRAGTGPASGGSKMLATIE
jgi:hypothetical protein